MIVQNQREPFPTCKTEQKTPDDLSRRRKWDLTELDTPL